MGPWNLNEIDFDLSQPYVYTIFSFYKSETDIESELL